MGHKIRSTGLMLLAASLTAWAAFEYNDYLSALCTRESGCSPGIKNGSGYIGLYQMGEAALIDAGYYKKDGTNTNDWKGSWTGKNGINSLGDFYASAPKQTQAIYDYNVKQWGYIKADGSDKYVGQTINGVLITESGLLAGAHLVGNGGLHKFLASKGQVVPTDGNKVAITNYIGKFSGYNIAPITGHNTAEGVGNIPNNTGDTGADETYLNYLQDSGSSGEPTPGTSVAPSVAFESGSGLAYGDVKLLTQSIIATVLLLLAAYVALGQFKLWGGGAISIFIMQNNIIKVTLMVLLLLIFTVT